MAKKLSKKEKARLEAEAAEQMRIEMEKERMRKVEQEKSRMLKEKREAEKRQHQEVDENRIRKKQLRESLNILLKIKSEIRDIHREEQVEREWQAYMRCTGQPDTRDPGDLRKYIYMWVQSMAAREKADTNWLLLTNAQSVLTQDQTIPTMSYEALRAKQPILGDYYAARLKEVLEILKELEYTIEEEELSDSILQELHELKAQFRILVSDFLDDFSFKILLNIARDMDLHGLSVATYKYDSEQFKAQLYTTRDMPEPVILNPKEKSMHDARHIEIDFSVLGVEIMLPPSIKCHYSAIRGMWMDFDHFSDYCHTIFNPHPIDLSRNIRQMTKGEWKKRKEILKMVLEEILSDKPQPEENPDDPEAVQPKRVLDVDKIYTDYEDEMRKEERRKKGPKSLKLHEYEVNLRSHRIIGGVYIIDYVEQPLQHVKLGPKAYLRTLPLPSKLTKRPFHQPYIPPPVPEPGVRRLPEEIEAELKMVEENLDKLALVTLQLPETVFWFEPPIVCRWEPDTVKAKKTPKTTFQRRKLPSVKIVEDFNILDVPCSNQLQTLITDFVIPKIPDGYGVKIGRLDPEVLQSSSRKIILHEVEMSPQLGKLIYETNSPSFLHPYSTIKRILQVVSSKGYSEYSETFNNEETDTSDMKDHQPEPEPENVYMFSKFMQDLDELIENIRPVFEREIEIEEVEVEPEPEEPPEAEEPMDLAAELALLKLDDVDINQQLLLTSQQSTANLFGIKKEIKIEEPEPEPDIESEDEEEECVDEPPRKHFGSKKIAGRWLTDDIHDVKYNEDKLQMQFRIGKLGAFGFATPRYSNIPFQGWDLKPDVRNPGNLIFTITASIMTAEWVICSEGIKLTAIQGGTTNALESKMNKVFAIRQMIHMMRSVSADVFPDDDAFYYVDGSCEKNPVMEFHLYNCMGTMCGTHNFSWSRWNQHVGSRCCVILMREIMEHRKLPHFSTVQVTPLKACVVDCTEVGAQFSSQPVPGMETYYADLHQLNMATTTASTLEKQQKMCPKLRDNATNWMKSVRPLSFA